MKEQTVLTKELERLQKKRIAYTKRYATKKEVAPQLSAKIPETLCSTLNAAFTKAFELVYHSATPLIEKTYNKQNAQQQYQINQFTYQLRPNKKSLRTFSKQASSANAANLLFSAAEGVGLGLIGCGLPDIPLFTGVILRNLYEISANYGYDYTKPEEQFYQLLVIQGAMSYGTELDACLEQLDMYTKSVAIADKDDIKSQIKASAAALADEMLFLKFVQGIPLVGVVGGLSDTVFLRRIQHFAMLNYQYRFLHERLSALQSTRQQ